MTDIYDTQPDYFTRRAIFEDVSKQKGKLDQANSHLISCAPDMYAMLEEIHDSLLHKSTGRAKQIGDLLKKARGES